MKKTQLKQEKPIIKKTSKPILIPKIEKLIKITTKTRYKKIQRTSNIQKIPLLINVKTDINNISQKRSGLDLLIIIDISGSMGGKKLKLIKKTLNFIITELKEIDRLSLLTFNKKTNLLSNFIPMEKQNKELIKKKVDEIKADGATNIIEAFKIGMDLLINRKYINSQTACFFLSDGEDTYGGDLKLLKKILFKKDEILREKNMGYSIHSFGYGEDYDEDVLSFISKFTNGKFYYIQNLKFVTECFIDCLASLLTIIAKNGNVNVFLDNSDIEISQKFGNYWKDNSNSKNANINLGAISSEFNKNYLLEIDISKIPEDEKEIKISFVFLTFTIDDEKFSKKNILKLQIVEDSDLGEIDKILEEEYIKQKMACELEEFEILNNQGRYDEAEERMNLFHLKMDNNKNLENDFKNKMRFITKPQKLKVKKYNRNFRNAFAHQQYIPGFTNINSQSKCAQEMVQRFYM